MPELGHGICHISSSANDDQTFSATVLVGLDIAYDYRAATQHGKSGHRLTRTTLPAQSTRQPPGSPLFWRGLHRRIELLPCPPSSTTPPRCQRADKEGADEEAVGSSI
jgi:hypothetical protein